MFAQCFPVLLDYSQFTVHSVNDPNVNLVVSIVALTANVLALGYVVYRAKKLKRNPYTNEVFVGTRDYDKALGRAE